MKEQIERVIKIRDEMEEIGRSINLNIPDMNFKVEFTGTYFNISSPIGNLPLTIDELKHLIEHYKELI